MNNNFPRIITLLRKERKLSQKQAAMDLQISQALLSHYEKGIRECGLDFVVRCADYYDVSCDYILGKTPDRSGITIKVEDIPENNPNEKENAFKGSLLPTLNKKLISNSLIVIFDLLKKINNKDLVIEVSSYLMLSVYKMFRLIYSNNSKNPQGLFAVPKNISRGMSSAAMNIAEENITCICSGENVFNLKGINKNNKVEITPEIISEDYPLIASSLYTLIQNTETRMGIKK